MKNPLQNTVNELQSSKPLIGLKNTYYFKQSQIFDCLAEMPVNLDHVQPNAINYKQTMLYVAISKLILLTNNSFRFITLHIILSNMSLFIAYINMINNV